MRTPSFRIIPLSTDVADAARRAAKAGRPDHAMVIADSPHGFPCRHCLRWAEPGERLVLFPFAAIAPGRPYSESGPIFVHEDRCERYPATHEYPAEFRQGRAVRAYNADHNMIGAQLVSGEDPEAVIERFLGKPETAFVHVRSASHGCYTMQIERLQKKAALLSLTA
jgi:Protein of unknown function (DUF1203)